jgi:hypothetical protein
MIAGPNFGDAHELANGNRDWKLDAREGLQRDLPLMNIDIREDEIVSGKIYILHGHVKTKERFSQVEMGGSMHGTAINCSRLGLLSPPTWKPTWSMLENRQLQVQTGIASQWSVFIVFTDVKMLGTTDRFLTSSPVPSDTEPTDAFGRCTVGKSG